jgi:hypothetical protein
LYSQRSWDPFIQIRVRSGPEIDMTMMMDKIGGNFPSLKEVILSPRLIFPPPPPP